MLQHGEHVKMEKFIETMPTIIQIHLIIELIGQKLQRKQRIQNTLFVTHWLLPHLSYKVQVQFLAYIHVLHNHKIKIQTAIQNPLKAQKVQEERNQGKVNQKLNSSLNHLPLPQKMKNNLKRQTTITITKIIGVITEATNSIGVNRVAAENLTEVPNKGEGIAKPLQRQVPK